MHRVEVFKRKSGAREKGLIVQVMEVYLRYRRSRYLKTLGVSIG